jgi:transcriptional regulator with PAS, ATPase and Fis domain
LQDNEITRVGGTKTIKTDVRLIAATSRDLLSLISEDKFRDDFYYRLRVIDIKMPALRERRGDIPLLVEYFLGAYNHRYRR